MLSSLIHRILLYSIFINIVKRCKSDDGKDPKDPLDLVSPSPLLSLPLFSSSFFSFACALLGVPETLLSTKSVTFGRHQVDESTLNKYYIPNVEVIYDCVAIAKKWSTTAHHRNDELWLVVVDCGWLWLIVVECG